MTDIGDSLFHEGQPVWVIQDDGSQRAAEYVGEGELSAWFGGAPTVLVIYPDTRTGGPVEVDRVIAREMEWADETAEPDSYAVNPAHLRARAWNVGIGCDPFVTMSRNPTLGHWPAFYDTAQADRERSIHPAQSRVDENVP